MAVWSKIQGTISTLFQFGLGGPQIKANAGNIEARNSADTGFVVVRGGTPVGNSDLTNKQYVDTIGKVFIASAQFDGNNALPANTAVERFLVVTTTGANASIGDLLWDDGQNTGTMVKLLAGIGKTIFTTAAFTGGTITLAANAFYVWDGTTWLLEASSTNTGSLRAVRYTLTNANGAQDSATKIPANAIILRARINIALPYSGGTTISVGQAGSLSLLQATTDNLATVIGIYEVPQETAWGGAALVVRCTIAGAPAAGAGFCTVEYTVPDA